MIVGIEVSNGLIWIFQEPKSLNFEYFVNVTIWFYVIFEIKSKSTIPIELSTHNKYFRNDKILKQSAH